MAIADIPREVTAAVDEPSSALLRRNLDRLARRRNQVRMARALVLGAIPGVGCAAISILLYRLFLVDGPAWLPLVMIGTGLLVGWRLGASWRAGTFVAAWDADCALGTQDRMASALTFVAPGGVRHNPVASRRWNKRVLALVRPPASGARLYPVPPTNLVPALVTEAADYSEQLDPRRVYPVAFGRPEQLLLVLSVFCLIFAMMPDQPVFRSAEEKKTAAILEQQGAQLVEVAKRIEHDDRPKPDQVRALSRRMEKLGQQMLRGRMTKRVALTQMGELRQELEKAQAQSTQDQSSNSAQLAVALKAAPLESEAGRDVQRDLQNNKWDDAAKKLNDLADKIESGQLSKTEKEQTARDLERTAQELRARGGDANRKMADQLQGAANALRQPQPQSPQPHPPSVQTPSGQSGQQNQNQNGQQGNHGGQPPHPGQQGGQQPGQQGTNGQNPLGGHQSPMGMPHPGGMPGAQSQQHQGGQQGQNGHSGQSQPGGQSGSQQGQSGSQSPQSGSQPGQSGSQSGQQGSQGQSGAGQGQPDSGQGGGDQSAANALRNMANGLQGGSGGGSGDMNDMLNKIHEAENQTGPMGATSPDWVITRKAMAVRASVTAINRPPWSPPARTSCPPIPTGRLAAAPASARAITPPATPRAAGYRTINPPAPGITASTRTCGATACPRPTRRWTASPANGAVPAIWKPCPPKAKPRAAQSRPRITRSMRATSRTRSNRSAGNPSRRPTSSRSRTISKASSRTNRE